MKFLPSIPPFALLASLASGQVTIFEGAPGQPGNVVRLTTPGFRPPELQGIVLLGLDFVARTQLDDQALDRPRRRADVPGAARLILPSELGSLYRYQRPGPSGAAFGFFRVGVDGGVQPLFELPGTGPSGLVDPFLEKIALAPDSRAFLIASRIAAGGNLLEVDLFGTGVIDRTPQVAPLEFGRNGLALLDTWGFGVSRNEILRFERTASGQAEVVVVSPLPSWYGQDVAWSSDRSTVAFLAGTSATQAFVWTCRRTGSAQRASAQAMHLSSAGYLPEVHGGPTLALSSDGSWVVWRTEGSSHEVFARPTIGALGGDQHLTGQTHFDNTLNDTGVIAFFDRDSVLLAAGREASDGLDRCDLYRIDLQPQGQTVTNLTLTSGISLPPHDYGTLRTSEGLLRWSLAGRAPRLLTYDRGDRRLLLADATGAVTQVLDRVASLDSVTVVGDHLVSIVTRPPGVDDPLVSSLNLLRISTSGSITSLVRLPSGCHVTRDAASVRHGVYSAVLEFANGERLGRMRVLDGRTAATPPARFRYGPTVGMAQDGSTLASAELGLEVATFGWSDQSSTVFRVSRGESFLLPGL
jgi:hypothetical protein